MRRARGGPWCARRPGVLSRFSQLGAFPDDDAELLWRDPAADPAGVLVWPRLPSWQWPTCTSKKARPALAVADWCRPGTACHPARLAELVGCTRRDAGRGRRQFSRCACRRAALAGRCGDAGRYRPRHADDLGARQSRSSAARGGFRRLLRNLCGGRIVVRHQAQPARRGRLRARYRSFPPQGARRHARRRDYDPVS